MAGGKGARGGSRFMRHLQMKRALGIPASHRMWPVKPMRGKDRRRGIWWNKKENCIAIEGRDFAQDTQEGGADEFMFIPDSDQEGVAKGSSLPLLDNDEYVPETEPQDVVTVSKITGSCANQGHQSLEKESGKVEVESDKFEMCGKVQMDTVKLEKESVKVEMESDNFVMSAEVQMDTAKLEESAKVQMGSVTMSRITGLCDNHGRMHLGTALREWRRLISDVDNESGKVDMESAKVKMDTMKLEKESAKVQMGSVKLEDNAKVQMGSVKLEKQSAMVQIDSVKVEMDSAKELDHIVSFSDIETDDKTCWFQDGVDLRGHSQVEDDDVNEQGLLIVFII